MIPKELIPIVAAYMGCRCEYSYCEYSYWALSSSNVSPTIKDKCLGFKALAALEKDEFFDLKLHLRPLSAITDEEMCELFDWEAPSKVVLEVERTELKNRKWTAAQINYLRSIGICVDPELIEAGLVKIIEPINNIKWYLKN